MFLGMRLMVTLSIQIMSVSVQYFVYELTGDPLKLGLIGLAEAIPAIAVSLYAGHLADKYNRKKLLIACITLLLICSIGLFSLVFLQTSIEKTWIMTCIYALVFLTGVARGFFSPTNFSFLPQLVHRKTLANAISWSSSTWEIASITGLGLGGVLYGIWGGPHVAFGAMIGLCLIGLVLIAFIPSRPVPKIDHTEPVLSRIREGIRFVFSRQLIIATLSLDLFAVLFGGAVALLPVYAKDILKVGPEGLGALRAAMSIGAILMALFIAHRPLGKNAGKILFAAVAGFGICMIIFGISTSFWLSFWCLFIAGMLDSISVFIRSSLAQHLTPDHMKGRVASISSIFVTSSNEIGAFESGVVASMMGTVNSVLFGGGMTILVVLITWWKAPKLRTLNFNELKDEDK